MSSTENTMRRAGYECEHDGDAFILLDGDLRLVAEGARWVGGSGAEIKATIRILREGVPVDSVALNLNNRAARKRTLKDLKTDHDVVLADSAIVALENFIRERLPRVGDGGDPPSLEPSNTPAEVPITDALTAFGRDPNLLEQVSTAIRIGGGWAGDVRPPLLGYVAMTSCLLVEPARPINLAYVSQAGTGKNKAVDAACAVIPEERCFLQRAGSEKSLIYVEEPFQYRMVIFAEADSIPDDGPAASAIRSLASDNIFAYDVPEQNPDTNKFETRRISKPGPTGLITTSTRSLQHQLGTRVLEVHLHDDPAQTARIIDVQAAECDGTPRPVFDASPFVDFQRWLSATAPHRVVVPFARALGSLVPTATVRMRRDFPQLLSCIRSIALLHKLQRDVTNDGAVIADLADYVAARDLLMPIFDSLATEGVTAAIRATVEAVPEGGPEITQTALQVKLKLAKSTVSWRVGRALKGGWLNNVETRRGSPARLVRGEPLPETAVALPTVERVREVFESSRTGLTDTTLSTSADVFECSNGLLERVGEPAAAVLPVGSLGAIATTAPNGWFDLDGGE